MHSRYDLYLSCSLVSLSRLSLCSEVFVISRTRYFGTSSFVIMGLICIYIYFTHSLRDYGTHIYICCFVSHVLVSFVIKWSRRSGVVFEPSTLISRHQIHDTQPLIRPENFKKPWNTTLRPSTQIRPVRQRPCVFPIVQLRINSTFNNLDEP